MRVAGSRAIRSISVKASGELLKEGALFNDELHKLPTGKTTRFPRGAYKYATHEEANLHWEQCVVDRIAHHDE